MSYPSCNASPAKYPCKFKEVVKNRYEVTATRYSPSGNYVASGGENREEFPLDTY